jgi:hypothetical protein
MGHIYICMCIFILHMQLQAVLCYSFTQNISKIERNIYIYILRLIPHLLIKILVARLDFLIAVFICLISKQGHNLHHNEVRPLQSK